MRITSEGRKAAGVLLLAIVAAGLLAMLRQSTAMQALLAQVESVRSAGATGAALLGVAYALGFAFFFPGILMSMSAGFLYGPLAGLWLAYPASIVGAVISFVLGRTLLRDVTTRRLARYPRLQALERSLCDQGVRLVVLLRLTPLVPFAIQNFSLGASRLPLRDLVVGSVLGNGLPCLFHAYAGSLVTNAADLASPGAVAGSATTASYWVGLVASVFAVVVVVTAARRALSAGLSLDAPPAPEIAPDA